MSLTLPSNQSRVAALSAVVRLFLPRRPSAITGLIVAVIVDAIESHPGWAFAHISEKVLKYLPPVADANPAATVIGIELGALITASSAHPIPDMVNASAAPSAMAVPRISGYAICNRLAHATPTTYSSAAT